MAHIIATVEKEKELTTYVVKGRLTADELIKKVEEFYTGNPTRLVLWLLEDADSSGIMPEDIERVIILAKKYSGSRKNGKTAIVGPKDIDYGMGRMYQAYADIEDLPYEYRIFRSFKEAMGWLETGNE